ncbi:MAG: T9SS type A sorting domain-containing protein [Bacteroidetes bacterium]|nr:T9SS type A sorting domain-containing protein [Bacteroidota bacterium]
MKIALPILLLLCFGSVYSFAQPGTLDSTYGINGHFNDSFSKRYTSEVTKILSISNGGTIVLGDTGSGDFGMIIRCSLKNGARDGSFGTNGNAITGVDSTSICFSAALQADEKILTTGTIVKDNMYQLLCLRLKRNGTPDSTFGTNGHIIVYPPAHAQTFVGEKISITQDNKIIIGATVVDSSYNTYAAIIKLNSNASFDSAFGNNGICTVIIDTAALQRLQSCVPLRKGKICIAGPSIHSNAIAMITADGKLDPSFGIAGKVRLDSQGFGSLMEQADGKIIASIYSLYTAGPILLRRFNTNGTTDSTWGKDGIVQANDASGALTLLPSGCFVAGGQYDSGFVVSRYKPDGSADSSFGINGMTHIPASLFNRRITQIMSSDMVVDTNDKSITFAGHVNTSSYSLFKLKLDGNTAVPFLASSAADAYLYPNPAGSEATLHFSLSETDAVSITIYDINGKVTQTVMQHKTFATGTYNIPMNLGSLQPGIYFVRMQGKTGQQTLRLVKE